jgi:AcrR family transcriptional regulator
VSKSEHQAGSNGARSSQTRQRILDATAEILSRKGYSGTRLGDIADLAALQAPAIYYYFSSRHELLEEVVRMGQAKAQEHVRSALSTVAPETPALEKICIAVEEHLRVVLDHSVFATAAIRNIGQLPDEMRQRLLQQQIEYGQLWQELFREAQANGELRPGLDLRAAQLLVIGALNWAPEWWSPRRDSVDSVVATARAITFHGLAAGGEVPPSRQ